MVNVHIAAIESEKSGIRFYDVKGVYTDAAEALQATMLQVKESHGLDTLQVTGEDTDLVYIYPPFCDTSEEYPLAQIERHGVTGDMTQSISVFSKEVGHYIRRQVYDALLNFGGWALFAFAIGTTAAEAFKAAGFSGLWGMVISIPVSIVLFYFFRKM